MNLLTEWNSQAWTCIEGREYIRIAEDQIFSRQVLCGSRRNETSILLVKYYNKVQSLPWLTLLSSNDERDAVARDAFILGVFIALVAEILCVNVAGSTLSSVVWEVGKDDEMAEGADIKAWLDEPAKLWSEHFKKYKMF